MPELQRPDFVNRAAGEVDRLRQEIRQGVRGTEEVLTEYWENLQLLLDDLLGWVSSEVERIGIQGEEQRRQLESRVRDLAGSASGVVLRAGDAIGLGPRVDPSVTLPVAGAPGSSSPAEGESSAPRKAAAEKASGEKTAGKKASGKKTAGKKAGAEKASGKKTAGKKVSAKKVSAKKVSAKKVPAKKAGAKQAGAKKGAGKKAPAKKAPAGKSAAG